MTPADLSVTVLRAVRRAVDEGALPRGVAVPERVVVERPRAGGCGDWATNAALRLARDAGMAPLAVAEVLSSALRGEPGIGRVDVTGPGFLNVTVDGAGSGVGAALREVGVRGVRYGFGEGMRGEDVELVHGGGVRERVYAEAVRGLLAAQGADVRVREGKDVSVVVRGAHYDPRGLGADACQWALLRPAAGDRVLDGPPLLVQGESNPLFVVRYAHARARALVRNAAEWGFAGEWAGDEIGGARLGGLIVEYPGVLEAAARLRAPDRVARALEAVADALLDFQHGVLPMGEEKPSAAHRSRLALAEAAGTVLAGGLALLGVSAPDHL
ncbi:ArgS-related anticodon-binding protein NrtL [Streptomyces lichenis]|uniref:arginine--tRNA ligase n=1 Tax=Streptomyces lichenis TaxID=2306967 RepID=A0ABT0I7Z5_9ACTN|nr:DALR anticodon-binding domain-containing protein [Streptomyces lichenis]MCK8677441.1 DALR anticodon-binding domain-containing protein [Streptomyces lichenis]